MIDLRTVDVSACTYVELAVCIGVPYNSVRRVNTHLGEMPFSQTRLDGYDKQGYMYAMPTAPSKADPVHRQELRLSLDEVLEGSPRFSSRWLDLR